MVRIMRPTHKNPYYRFSDDYSPLNKTDFKVPPRSSTGNKTPRPIWESVGRALSCWAAVERELHMTFDCLNQSETRTSWSALGALVGFRSQLEVIEATAEQCFQAKTNKNLKAIRSKIKIIREAVARRNEFAHGQVNEFEGSGHFFVPSIFATRKISLGKLAPDSMKYCYTSEDIRAITQKFIYLDMELYNLNSDTRAAVRKKYPQSRF